MKLLSSWSDLEAFGIVYLTAESCGLMYRLLCDVTADGLRVVRTCFGVPTLELGEPWNRGTVHNPHVGSLLLPHQMLQPLMVFALLENGCRECWLLENHQVLGVEYSDAGHTVIDYRSLYEGKTIRVLRYAGTAGDRNLHVMSGRTV